MSQSPKIIKLGLWALRNIGGPVTSLETLAVVGPSHAWFVVRHAEGTLVEELTTSRVLVKPVLFPRAESCVRVHGTCKGKRNVCYNLYLNKYVFLF